MSDTPAPVIVRVMFDSNGQPTPHDGRYVVGWDPHTRAGVLCMETSTDPRDAHVFASLQEAMQQRHTISNVQALRPWDGQPNRPLTGIAVEFLLAHSFERIQ